MALLPLNIRTLYADLVQSVTFSDIRPGSVAAVTVKDNVYLYVTEKHGGARRRRFLGRADHPEAAREAEAVRRAAADARLRRRTVSLLKRAGVQAPSLESGRLLEAVAMAGLFAKGVILVGTAAYQMYPPIVGASLSGVALTTQDADLAAASLALTSDIEGESLLDILHRADPTFVAAPGLDRKALPKRFRSGSGFEVEVLTRFRRRADEERPVPIPGLRCAAQPLRYIEYLMEEPIEAVALYGAGVRVCIPQPARYAVHKMIVAQVRKERGAKRAKDLVQARELYELLSETDPQSLGDALAEARSRGRAWASHIGVSLKELGH
jgi:hypothetical protein